MRALIAPAVLLALAFASAPATADHDFCAARDEVVTEAATVYWYAGGCLGTDVALGVACNVPAPLDLGTRAFDATVHAQALATDGAGRCVVGGGVSRW